MQLAKLQELVHYWGTGYDWRKVEAKLNALPQFVTEIDGLDIHFIHVRSRHPNALPLIITHGWPGSVLETAEGHRSAHRPHRLRRPRGGRLRRRDSLDARLRLLGQADGAPAGTPTASARAWDVLMKRLGYKRYVSQGGDWGSVVADAMARRRLQGLLGIHVNMPATVPADVAKALNDGDPAPAGLSAKEKAAFDSLNTFYTKNAGYAAMMVTRPQTVGLRADGLAGRAGRVDVRQVRAVDLQRRRPGALADQGRDARRHHALLGHEHRDLVGAALLGEQRRTTSTPVGHLDPGRR